MIYYDLIVVVSFLTLFFCIFSYFKSEKFINPASIISIWFGGTLVLSLFNLIDLNYPKRSTYNLLILSFITLNIGILTFLKRINTNIEYKEESTIKNSIILKLYFIAHIILFFILLFFLKRAAGMLATLNPQVYRALVYNQDTGVFKGYINLVIFFIRPMVYSGLIMGISGLYLKAINKKLGIICVSNSVLYSVVIVGRFNFIFIFFCLFFGFVYSKRITKKKLTKKLTLILSAPFLLILLMSLFRNIKSTEAASKFLFRYVVWYSSGQYSALEYFLNNYYPQIDYHLSYCGTLFSGIEAALAPFLRKIYGYSYALTNEEIYKITSVFRSIGNNIVHNSMYTMLLNFYRDLGILGVALYSYIWGAFNAFSYNYFFKKPSIFSLSLLLLTTYLLIMSAIRWEVMMPWVWNALVLTATISLGNKIFKLSSNKIVKEKL